MRELLPEKQSFASRAAAHLAWLHCSRRHSHPGRHRWKPGAFSPSPACLQLESLQYNRACSECAQPNHIAADSANSRASHTRRLPIASLLAQQNGTTLPAIVQVLEAIPRTLAVYFSAAASRFPDASASMPFIQLQWLLSLHLNTALMSIDP